jgi:hypothetical protein
MQLTYPIFSNEKEASVMSTMKQRVLAMLALAALSVFAVPAEQAESSAQPTRPAENKSGYAPVNGLKMYVESDQSPLPDRVR